MSDYPPPHDHHPGLPGIMIAAPSYHRHDGTTIQRYWPGVALVVMESEAEAYEAQGLTVWRCPDSAQGNLCRVRNWIMDNSPCRRLLLVDDDLGHVGIWNGTRKRRMTGPQALEFIEHGFDMADAVETPLWGLNCVAADKGAYREYTPLGLTAYIGGPFQGHAGNPLRYDEALPLKEDYDMTLQVLCRYRRTLRFNMAYYVNKFHSNTGGCSSMRTIQRERDQLARLRRKWGAAIVKTDGGEARVTRKREKGYDLNPIIKAPIKGV